MNSNKVVLVWCAICQKQCNRSKAIRVPKCDIRRQRWIAHCGINLSKNACVGEYHFADTDFINGRNPPNGRRALQPGALPSLNAIVPDIQEEQEYADKSTGNLQQGVGCPGEGDSAISNSADNDIINGRRTLQPGALPSSQLIATLAPKESTQNKNPTSHPLAAKSAANQNVPQPTQIIGVSYKVDSNVPGSVPTMKVITSDCPKRPHIKDVGDFVSTVSKLGATQPAKQPAHPPAKVMRLDVPQPTQTGQNSVKQYKLLPTNVVSLNIPRPNKTATNFQQQRAVVPLKVLPPASTNPLQPITNNNNNNNNDNSQVRSGTHKVCLDKRSTPISRSSYTPPLEGFNNNNNNNNNSQVDCGCQTDGNPMEYSYRAEIYTLKEEIKQLKEENRKLRLEVADVKALKSSIEKIFTKGQVQKLRYPDFKIRWTLEDVSNAMSLYSASPETYMQLYYRGYPLPHSKTLQNWSRDVPIKKVNRCHLQKTKKLLLSKSSDEATDEDEVAEDVNSENERDETEKDEDEVAEEEKSEDEIDETKKNENELSENEKNEDDVPEDEISEEEKNENEIEKTKKNENELGENEKNKDPVSLCRAVLEAKYKFKNKAQLARLLNYPFLIEDPKLANNAAQCLTSDNQEGPLVDLRRRLLGEEYEFKVSEKNKDEVADQEKNEDEIDGTKENELDENENNEDEVAEDEISEEEKNEDEIEKTKKNENELDENENNEDEVAEDEVSENEVADDEKNETENDEDDVLEEEIFDYQTKAENIFEYEFDGFDRSDEDEFNIDEIIEYDAES